MNREVQEFEDVFETVGGAFGGEADLFGLTGDEVHADGKGFAVAVSVVVAVIAFQGMADGVAEIEEHALAFCEFILFRETGLNAAAAFDNFRKSLLQVYIVLCLFKNGKQVLIFNAGNLYRFGQTGVEFFCRKGIQQIWIDENASWLSDAADKVLAVRGIQYLHCRR